MSLFDKITAKNFNAFALKNYDDPQCEDIEDFHEDLRRFRYLKRLLHRYHESGEMRERLMLNHLITIFNVFGFDAPMRMLDFKIKNDKYWSSIKTMLLYLSYVENTWRDDTPLDVPLANRLKQL
jgi:ABC-type sugar transport system ATPase subunit